MKCPHCDVDLVMTTRNNVEIDYCPKCRGVWLDRGELDKIIERATALERTYGGDDDDDDDDDRRRPRGPAPAGYAPPPGPPPGYPPPHQQQQHPPEYYKHKKKSWWKEMFDFD